MKFISLILCLILLNCKSETKKKNDIILTTINESQKNEPLTWMQYSIKDSIPWIITRKLNELSESNFELANPNEPFQHSDAIVNDKLPRRQLKFLGKSNNIWIITYMHGGVGLHYHFVICKIANNEIESFRVGVSLVDLDTITQIEKALTDQKIDFKNIDSKEEVDKI
jgi:hypothetical protein